MCAALIQGFTFLLRCVILDIRTGQPVKPRPEPSKGDLVHRFKSVGHLCEWLQKPQSLVFTSKPKRLGRWHILLHSLAGGDWNPAHCQSAFSKKSFFQGTVSHGVGVLARAEGQFVELLPRLLETPVEIITRGYGEVKYFAPLRLGDTYQYRFEITNPRLRNDGGRPRINLDCRIICEVLGQIVAEAKWKPSLVEHVRDPETMRLLGSKSHVQNVMRVFLPAVAIWIAGLLFYGFGLMLVVSGPLMFLLSTVGIIEMNSSGFGEYFGTGP